MWSQYPMENKVCVGKGDRRLTYKHAFFCSGQLASVAWLIEGSTDTQIYLCRCTDFSAGEIIAIALVMELILLAFCLFLSR